MTKFKSLNEFISFNPNFRNAINLYLNLNNKEKILSYIPTKSSVEILKRYLKAVKNNNLHASMLIGPYGKGKSHLLLILLAILSMDRTNKDEIEIFNILLSKIEKVDSETSDMMEEIWNQKNGRFLPVIINCQGDVKQAFLLAMNQALNNYGLGDLVPDTYFEHANLAIDNWKNNYPDTYDEYCDILKKKKITPNQMTVELSQYNEGYLNIFKELYPELTSGSNFNPLAESEVTKLYTSIADKLREAYGYRGIYIVFDEFSKFIEGQDEMSAGINMQLIQSICEMAGDAKDPEIYITLVAHKPIKEYGNKLKKETIDSFTGIEGRLDDEVYFKSSAKNNYELIQNAIFKKDSDLDGIPKSEIEKYFSKDVVGENFAVPGFSTEFTKEDFEKIVVRGCYPLTPISSYLLLNISEKVAQNERTLFTFISKEEQLSMIDYVKNSASKNGVVSSNWSIKPDLIYDYFANLFKNDSDEIKGIYLRSVTAIDVASKKYKHNEAPIIILKTLATLMITNKRQELPWDHFTLRMAVNMNYSESIREKYEDAIANLIELGLIDVDGDNFYKFKTLEGTELEDEISKRWKLVTNDNTISSLLQNIFDTKYVFPKRYNYEYGITRYFRFDFKEVNDFLKISNDDIFFEDGLYCDGKVVCIYKYDDNAYFDEVRRKVEELKSHKLVVVYTDKTFDLKDTVYKLQVLYDIKDDFKFMEKNGKLSAEIEAQEDVLETKILSLLDKMFGRFGEFEISYFLEDKIVSDTTKTITDAVDNLCYKIFDKTPVINNEFVNKQIISTGATQTARKKIMTRMLNKESLDDYLEGTSQDATIYRALFVRNGVQKNDPEARIAEVLNIMTDFFDRCAGQKQVLADLFNVITKEPYGMRLGVLPLYISYIIGKRDADVVIYYGDKEIPLNADTIFNMCDYPQQYAVFISVKDQERELYLNDLCDLFRVNTKNDGSESRITVILEAMQKWYRALPQVTKNVKRNTEYFEEAYYTKAITRMGNILQRYEVNPYEVIFSQVPEAFDAEGDYTLCTARFTRFKEKMTKYIEWIQERAILETKKVFGNTEDSLYHGIVEWYEAQSDKAKGIIDEQSISTLMNTISNMEKNAKSAQGGDISIVEKIVKAVNGVYIDYWNANSLNQYIEQLIVLKRRIEEIQDQDTHEEQKLVYVSRNGQSFFYEDAKNEDTKMFRDILAGTIEDYEGLGKNELIAVLLDEVERILGNNE